MKINKLLFAGVFALAMTACSDEPEMGSFPEEGPKEEQPSESEDPTEDPEEEPKDPEEDPEGDPEEDNTVSPTPSFTLNGQLMTVNMNKTYQEIEGFGASDCWLPNQIGQYWTSNRGQIAKMLFSQNLDDNGQPEGIGLSMWRFNLGAGTAEAGDAGGIDKDNINNRAESFLYGGTTYDWNKCAGQQYFLQESRNYGVDKVILFSNSPLVQFTKNGQGRSDSREHANLKDDCYDDFAIYMAEVADHFTKQGFNIAAISPVNEPQYNWDGTNQEGSGWYNNEIAKLTRELDKALTDRGLDTEISVGEAGSWTSLYDGNSSRERTINAFYNPNSEAYIGDLKHTGKIICGHSYWTHFNWTDMRNVRKRVADAASIYGLRVWQTEWSMLDRAPDGLDYDRDSEFDIAQYMSRVIHCDMTMANCTSWSYWTAMSVERWSQKNRFELIKTTPMGGAYSDNFTVGGTVKATHNLYVLGNYSLFIRPGFKRVELSHDENKNFFASAYIAPDKSKLVVVVTNYNKENGMSIKMDTPAGTKAIYTYTTTEDKKLAPARFNVKDEVFVDPASVTTIVYEF